MTGLGGNGGGKAKAETRLRGAAANDGNGRMAGTVKHISIRRRDEGGKHPRRKARTRRHHRLTVVVS